MANPPKMNLKSTVLSKRALPSWIDGLVTVACAKSREKIQAPNVAELSRAKNSDNADLIVQTTI